MKTRNGFVSNSSSSSFIIRNKSQTRLTLKDFVLENQHLIEKFNKEYNYNYTLKEVLKSCEDPMYKDYIWTRRSKKIVGFGDDHNTSIGQIFDYILRDGGHSKNWTWEFHQHCR